MEPVAITDFDDLRGLRLRGQQLHYRHETDLGWVAIFSRELLEGEESHLQRGHGHASKVKIATQSTIISISVHPGVFQEVLRRFSAIRGGEILPITIYAIIWATTVSDYEGLRPLQAGRPEFSLAYPIFPSRPSSGIIRTHSGITQTRQTLQDDYLCFLITDCTLVLSCRIFDDIERPLYDRTSYRLLHLANGVQVLLCSDRTSSTCGASICFRAGMLNQPEWMPGLAHLLEHCVFASVNSGKSNKDLEDRGHTLVEIVGQQGGNFEAETGPHWTTYSFEANASAFKEALPRIAEVLRPPVITTEVVGQEVFSVDAEFQQMASRDASRVRHLSLHLSRPGASAVRRFEGNLRSLTAHFASDKLAPETSRDEEWLSVWAEMKDVLQIWWAENYLSQPPTIVLSSPESLQDMKSAACALFAHPSFASRDSTREPDFSAKFISPWTKEHEGTVIFVRAVEDTRDLYMHWVIPYHSTSEDSNYPTLLRHSIIFRGPGSPYSALRERGWVAALDACLAYANPHEGHAYFEICIGLTEAGFYHWEAVVQVLEDYLAVLHQTPVAADVLDSFVRMEHAKAQLPDTNGDSVMERVQTIAVEMLSPYSRRHVVTGYVPATAPDPEDFRAWVEQITRRQKRRIMLVAYWRDEWEKLGVVVDDTWETAPGYGTRFVVSKEPPMKSDSDCATASALSLPDINPFITDDLSLLPMFENTEAELQQLAGQSGRSIWYKRDVQHLVPLAYVVGRSWSPRLSSSPEAFLYSHILCTAINRDLEGLKSNASAAGSNLSIEFHCGRGFTIQAYGFSDKLKQVFSSAMDSVAQPSVDPTAFANIRDNLCSSLEYESDSDIESFDNLDSASNILTRLFCMGSWGPSELYDAGQHVTYEGLTLYMDALTKQSQMRGLAYGNLRPEGALDMMGEYLSFFSSSSGNTQPTWISLPHGANYVLEVVKEHSTSTKIHYHLQLGPAEDTHTHTIWKLVTSVISATIYEKLVTRHELGYY
ncbi:peptidase M16 domain-containing protein [Phanerochaete sordida]|uniref:Peptidase M16 domain-containing protein n=1 Tax=Phanerochaete sordida TaxID=48140 RepID=A0A9P3LEE3_9APHY|nr:peptidase M16 domain-containing protein [Phanerochaete sordida]